MTNQRHCRAESSPCKSAAQPASGNLLIVDGKTRMGYDLQQTKSKQQLTSYTKDGESILVLDKSFTVPRSVVCRVDQVKKSLTPEYEHVKISLEMYLAQPNLKSEIIT